MTNYFICCEKCFEDIGRKSCNAAKLWMDLCALYLEEGDYFRLSGCSSEIRILEKMRFLLSTDEAETIAVHVKGHILSDMGEHFFCRKGGHHE